MLAFAWIELVYPSPAVPSHLACFAIVYSVLTWAGMVAFGETWLKHGEVFTLVFGTLARFAPTLPGSRNGIIVLRPLGTGLLDSAFVSPSMMAFVLLLLSTVLYDGAIATPEWSAFESTIVTYIPMTSGTAILALRTVGLVAFWIIFFGGYVLIGALMIR